MSTNGKKSTVNPKISSPRATGGFGYSFESNIQASFVILMLTGGYAPGLPNWPITKIKLQGKDIGFYTDDFIVTVEDPRTGTKRKMLGQIKSKIGINKNKELEEFLIGAWNDFNGNNFVRGRDGDCIALITGPMSKIDIEVMSYILSVVRHTYDACDFFQKMRQANYNPSKTCEKLKCIREYLDQANETPLSDKELYNFLLQFRMLGYDVDSDLGVVNSLLRSLISQFNNQQPDIILSHVIRIVQSWNQDGGTITLDNLPNELRDEFRSKVITQMSIEPSVNATEMQIVDWNHNIHANALAVMNLIGSWDEKVEADSDIVGRFVDKYLNDFDEFTKNIEEIKQIPDNPISKKEGIWKVTKRDILWEQLGSRIFDRHLETFKKIAIKVLSELDPAFQLPKDERYAANLYGKTPSYSSSLRKGISESLALLANKDKVLINCSHGKAKSVAVITVREILGEADWQLWGSLNYLLPIIAEAAPEVFLDAIMKSLELNENPFVELYSQESAGITGSNYLTGLLWALETLAWVPEYLIEVCVILGKLATLDKGGQWSNRPGNSLTTIFLPWLPQTLADMKKRTIALKTLCDELPDIGWELLIDLLPSNHGTSIFNPKPKWLIQVSEDISVTNKEYWEQISRYAELAFNMAEKSVKKLSELVKYIDRIDKTSIDKFILILSAPNIIELAEDERTPLWESLTHFINHHKRFADADWSWNEEQLQPIEILADKLAPLAPNKRYRLLFSDNTFDLYERRGDWKEQESKLNEKRLLAVTEVYQWGGNEAIECFISDVESPYRVGLSLGSISNEKTDQYFLSKRFMDDKKILLRFIEGYIFSCFQRKEWSWVDNLDRTEWTRSQTVIFLICLPFIKDTWMRVSVWLDIQENEYWQRVIFNPYRDEDQLIYAVERFLKCDRPYSALDCIYAMHLSKHQIPTDLCISALLAGSSSREQLKDTYTITELVKVLRDIPDIDEDKMIQIECMYLQLFDGETAGRAETMEYKLASDPEFFCEILRILYRSRKKDAKAKESSKHSKMTVENAWRLLQYWHITPGQKKNGSFDDNQFEEWITHVKRICNETGHIDIAMQTVGQVLIHTPADTSGLWINKTVARILNDQDHNQTRRGYSIGVANSRGAHWIDPAGTPEKELSVQYHQKAEEVENAGYHRFAITLRNIAKSYDAEAEEIISEHLQEEIDDEE